MEIKFAMQIIHVLVTRGKEVDSRFKEFNNVKLIQSIFNFQFYIFIQVLEYLLSWWGMESKFSSKIPFSMITSVIH